MTKKQVDNFREGKLTLCCQLKAEVSGRRKNIPVLNHRVLLQGTRRPYNFFTLELPVNDTNDISDVCNSYITGAREMYGIIALKSEVACL